MIQSRPGYINKPLTTLVPIEELAISPYKKKLLRMRIDGYTPKQIAHIESLKEGTINNHFAQIFHQHDTNSLLDFVIKIGWLRVISTET